MTLNINERKLNNELVMAKKTEDAGDLVELLNTGYDWIKRGIPTIVEPIEETTEKYRNKYTCVEEAAKALIRNHISYAASIGFVTGLGGVLTLPVTVPADLLSVALTQLRMIEGIAKLGGYNLEDDKVRTFIMACMTGQALNNVVRETGINVGEKLAIVGIKKIPGEVIKSINQKVGFRMLTKFGEKGVINIGKAVPVVGGVIGGGFDAVSTKIIADNAYRMFIGESAHSEEPINADYIDALRMKEKEQEMIA